LSLSPEGRADRRPSNMRPGSGKCKRPRGPCPYPGPTGGIPK
jgi:hypothetical protein